MKVPISYLVIFLCLIAFIPTSAQELKVHEKIIDNARALDHEVTDLKATLVQSADIQKKDSPRLMDRIEIPIGDDPFDTTIAQGGSQEYSILGVVVEGETPAAVTYQLTGTGSGNFDIDHDDAFLIGIVPGQGSVWDIWFTMTADANTAPGTYTVKLEIFFFNSGNQVVGLSFKDVINITVTGTGGSVVADFSGTPRTGDAPLTVQFTDQSTGNITSRQWDFGDGETSTETNPEHTYQSPGTYTVSLTVSNATSSDTETKSDYISVTTPELSSPNNLVASVEGSSVTLEWEPAVNSGTIDTMLIAYDDGSAENGLTSSTENAELCVRFTPTAYPASLVAMAFIGGINTPDTYGLRVYLDPDADNNGPSGQPVFESEIPITEIGVNGGTFANPLVIEQGDFYISLMNLSKTDGFAVGLDTNSPDAQRSWIKLDNQVAPLTGTQFEGNLVINAFVAIPTTASQPAIATHDVPVGTTKFSSQQMTDIFHKESASFMSRNQMTMQFPQSTIPGRASILMPNLQGYNVYRSQTTPVSIEQQNRIDDLPSNQLSYTDSNLPPGNYYYVVTAEYDTGESPPSNEVAATILVEVISVAQARTETDGAIVSVEGLVTRTKGRLTRIQDATAGITIFADQGTFSDAVQNGEVAPGDLLRVTGTMMEFNAAKEIHDVTGFEVLSRNNSLPDPPMVDLAEIVQNGEQYESELIRVTDLTIHAEGDAIFQPIKSYPVSDPMQQIGAVTLFIANAIDTELTLKPIPSDRVTFVGVLGQFSLTNPATGYQLVPVDTMDIQEEIVDSIPGEEVLPTQYSLQQNYPNPFNPETTIRYQLPVETAIKLQIYNLLGQPVKTLVDKKQPAGNYSVQWDGRDDQGRYVASGVYLYRLESEKFVKTKELSLIR